DPEEENLVTKALYASLQSTKRRQSSDQNDNGQTTSNDDTDFLGSCSMLPNKRKSDPNMENLFEKMHFAARKTASIVPPGLNSSIESKSVDKTTKSPPNAKSPSSPAKKPKYDDGDVFINGLPSTEKFIQFLILRGKFARREFFHPTKSVSNNSKNNSTPTPAKKLANSAANLMDEDCITIENLVDVFDIFSGKGVKVRLKNSLDVFDEWKSVQKCRIFLQKLHLLAGDEAATVRKYLTEILGKNWNDRLIISSCGITKSIDLYLLYLVTHETSLTYDYDLKSVCELSNSLNKNSNPKFWRQVVVDMGMEDVANDRYFVGQIKSLYQGCLRYLDLSSYHPGNVVNYMQENPSEFEDTKPSWLELKESDIAPENLVVEILSTSGSTAAQSKVTCELSAEHYFLNVLKYGYPAVNGLKASFFHSKSDGLSCLAFSRKCCLNFIADSEVSMKSQILIESLLCYQPWTCSNLLLDSAFYLHKSLKSKIWFVTDPGDFFRILDVLKLNVSHNNPISHHIFENAGINITKIKQKEGELLIIPAFSFYSSLTSEFSISEFIHFANDLWFNRIYLRQDKIRHSMEYLDTISEFLKMPNYETLLCEAFDLSSDFSIFSEKARESIRRSYLRLM
uniref:JmjC domain-containing protein n=1 Tax=Romanomermis culicivorax TaxID=13658 RepID=A0A915J048_ROMCU